MKSKFIALITVAALLAGLACGGGKTTGEHKKRDGQVVINPFFEGAPEERFEKVKVSGFAEIREDGPAAAYDRALEDAKRKAIKKVVGSIVDSKTIVDSGVMLESKVYTQSKGYLRSFTIIREYDQDMAGERVAGVEIEAEVGVNGLTGDLKALGLLIKEMNMPRVMVLTSETIDGKTKPLGDSYSGNRMIQALAAKGFLFVDPGQMDKVLAREGKAIAEAIRTGKIDKIDTKLLLDTGAEIVILGRATSKSAGSVIPGSKMLSEQANVVFRAVQTANAHILAVASAHSPGAHIEKESAAMKALETATAKIADSFIDQISKKWEQAKMEGGLVTLVVVGLSIRDQMLFADNLKKFFREVKEVYVRANLTNQMKADCQVQGTASEFARLLMAKDFGFTVEVTKIDGNSVTCTAKKK